MASASGYNVLDVGSSTTVFGGDNGGTFEVGYNGRPNFIDNSEKCTQSAVIF